MLMMMMRHVFSCQALIDGPHYWPTQIDRMVCEDLEKEVKRLNKRVVAYVAREANLANQEKDLATKQEELRCREAEMRRQEAVQKIEIAAFAQYLSNATNTRPPQPSTSAVVGESG
jgi:peptidoglycan hydrolase CwlO-like protein